MVNRYDDLVSTLPQGSAYEAVGNIIPYRGDSPYELIFSPVTASHTFGVYVNEQFRGEVTSDSQGRAIVRVVLDQGRQDILLIDTTTQARFVAYVDVRVSATVLAAHADALETIDERDDQIQAALSLETAGVGFIEEIYGRRVAQPNDLGGWLLESYRRLLRRLWQSFRVFGSKLAGLQQVVSGYTSSLPLRIPAAWRPTWALGFQLMPNGDLHDRARLTASPLTNLNARSLTFVHAAFGGAPTTFPGPFTDPPVAQPLMVRFSAAWDGGSVTVVGLDPLGNALTEVFTPLAAQPLVAAETVVGLENFATPTGATKGAGAAGTASIGVAVGRFIVIDVIGSLNPPAVARTLAYLTGPDRLRWATTGAVVEIPSSGEYTLRELDRTAIWFGLGLDTGAGFAVGANDRFLALEFDDLGIVVIDLTDAGFGGGASPRTAAQVATSINTYFARSTPYGAVRAAGTITVVAAALLIAGETVTLNDGINAAVVLRYRKSGSDGLGLVLGTDIDLVDNTPLASAVAGLTRNVINAQYSTLRIDAGNAAGSAVVTLENNFGGAQGNVAITDTVADAGFVVTGMSGGANSAVYSTVAAGVASFNAGVGATVRLLRTGGGPLASAATIRIHPWGADAARLVLGEPRFSSTLSASAAFRAVLLDLPAGGRLPTVDVAVILRAAFADTVALVTSSIVQPSHPSALEFFFDGAWRGGTLRVHGTALGGTVQTEDFVAPSNAVDSGASATSADGTTIVLGGGETFDGVVPGMFYRRATGVGAFVRYVDTSTQVRLAASVGVFGVAEAWAVTKNVQARGTLAFQTIVQIADFTPAGAGTAGNATLSIIDGELNGYSARVGRGLRQNGSGGAGRTITVLDSTGKTAAFQDTGTPLVTEYADLLGWLLVRGATDPTNNGLHAVYSLGTPATAGIDALFIRHQDADRGGRFVNETLPGGAVWQLYSAGDFVRVVGRDAASGDLTLYPPGLATPWGTGALVETADEMPFTAQGIEGPGTITVTVDRDYLPTGGVSDAITPSGTNVPDGWRALNQASPATDIPGYFGESRLQLIATGVDGDGIGTTDMCFQRELRPADVVTYRGFRVRAAFWVQQHETASEQVRIDFSFNGGAFTAGAAVTGGPANPVTIAGTHIPGTASQGALDPTLAMAEIEIPYNATSCVVRLRYLGAAVGPPFSVLSIERCIVVIGVANGLYLGTGTFAQSAQRAKFGEILYVWSPEALNASEKTALGIAELPASYPEKQGQIDRVVNAHGYWERFDVSEYSAGAAVNVVGAYDELDWLAATLSNMEIVVGTPARTSVVRPSKISLVSGEVLAMTAPSNATLAETSAHEGAFPEESFSDERLDEDDLPVPATPSVSGGVLPWRFLSATSIQVASVAAGDPAAQAIFNGAATYQINYRRLIRATPVAFDLGASFADYLWFVDAAIYRRTDPTSSVYVREDQLIFLASFRATLKARANKDKATSTLTRDTGLTRTVVPVSAWRYADALTVEINAEAFDPDSIYSLEYQALEPKYPRVASVVIETRSSAVSLVDVAAQTWRTVVVDELVDHTHRYHQLRATLTGVVDVRDVEISGLGLRGLHVYGTPYAPGLVTP